MPGDLSSPMLRKLSICFRPDRSVDYHFSRYARPLKSYLIEHPADQVQLLNAPHGYKVSVEANGWLRLTWDDSPPLRGWSIMHYRKLAKLLPVDNEQGCEHNSFSEDIRIKAHPRYGLWLGSSVGPLTAVGKLSNALFTSLDGQTRTFRPQQLEEHVFATSGLLQIRWILEPSAS